MARGDDGERAAGGFEAVAEVLRQSRRGPGLWRALQTLPLLNQTRGIDCPGCAWPEESPAGAVEFCENGAKALAHEATRKQLSRAFFAEHSLPQLRERSDAWLEGQGRLVEPLWKPADSEHYRALSWEQAFARIAAALCALSGPDRAVFYTSGRTSNEAAFLYQLFARRFGTNNLPDCSNLCHESSGVGLRDSIGVAKGTVGLEDFEACDLVLVLGQNPGSNHPRMLTTLRKAKARGARIVSINPLRERGLLRFSHPQDPRDLLGRSTAISDLYLQVKVGGDAALLQGLMREVLALEAERPGEVLDWDFLHRHTSGFEALREQLAGLDPQRLAVESGIAPAALREVAQIYARSQRVIACWAMGITQHEQGVETVQQIVNLLLLRGNLGRTGAGVCPVRGHSNVQGDRTMGIHERPAPDFLERLGREFDFAPPQRHGFDAIAALEALEQGRVDVLVSLGGNLAAAAPDPARTAAALARCALSVQISTRLNRSHLACGREALILPCLTRSEEDRQGGALQQVTVEDSMSRVHASRGRLAPAAPTLRSEPWIVAQLARAVLGPRDAVPWEELAADYTRIRERIARVVPGFEDFEQRLRRDGAFVLPNAARERRFETPDGRARFRIFAAATRPDPPGSLRLTTIRSHDQFNTTVYSDDDRYRGVRGDRRVLFVNPEDLAERGLCDGEALVLRRAGDSGGSELRGFRARAHDLPRGCAAGYFPELNALVPFERRSARSHTPAYKSVAISVEAEQVAGEQ